METSKLINEYAQKYQALDVEIEALYANRTQARKEINEAWYTDLTIEIKQKQAQRQCFYQFTLDLQSL